MDVNKMGHTSNLPCIGLLIRGLLVLLCVFAVPKLASSEADIPADQKNLSTKPPKALSQGGGYSGRASSRLYPDSNDCAAAKLDIWFQRGTVTHTVFLPGGELRFRALMGGAERETTMLVGERDCLIRVRIEPVPAGTTVYD
jgi:hypothetical protein